jgi:hypothetical protein
MAATRPVVRQYSRSVAESRALTFGGSIEQPFDRPQGGDTCSRMPAYGGIQARAKEWWLSSAPLGNTHCRDFGLELLYQGSVLTTQW